MGRILTIALVWLFAASALGVFAVTLDQSVRAIAERPMR